MLEVEEDEEDRDALSAEQLLDAADTVRATFPGLPTDAAGDSRPLATLAREKASVDDESEELLPSSVPMPLASSVACEHKGSGMFAWSGRCSLKLRCHRLADIVVL